jgi:hypothetical protein
MIGQLSANDATPPERRGRDPARGRTRRPSGGIATGALLLGALLVAGVALGVLPRLNAASPPDVEVFLLVERAPENASLGLRGHQIRADDGLRVEIRSPERARHVTVLVLDSADALILTPTRDVRVDAGERLALDFVVDDAPGTEQVLILSSDRPLGGLDAALERLNTNRDLARGERAEDLRAAIHAANPDGSVHITGAPALEHLR